MSTTIRVSDRTKERISSLARATGRQMTQILDDAIEALERKVFFERLNDRFRALRADPRAWAEIQAERAAEEGSLADDSA